MGTSQDVYFHAHIQRQTSLESASQVLAESAAALGWDLATFHIDITQASLPRARSGELIAATMGWPSECLDEWLNQGLGRHCPVGQHCSRSSEPFFWQHEPSDSNVFGRRLMPEQRQALDHYSHYISGGLAVPVHRAGGKAGYVSWCGRDRSQLRRLSEESFSSVYLISHTFIRHVDRIGKDWQHKPVLEESLTAREIECLGWVARGHTEEEVGKLLRRSRETVHFHLRNAVLKLDARNRAHAVAIACSRGLIAVG